MFSSLGRMSNILSNCCFTFHACYDYGHASRIGLSIFTNDTHVFHNLRSGRRHAQWGDNSDICIRPRRRKSCPQDVLGLPVGHMGHVVPVDSVGPVGPVGLAHPLHAI